MSDPMIAIKTFPNRYTRSYQVNTQIANGHFYRTDFSHFSTYGPNGSYNVVADDATKELFAHIFEINGIQEIGVDRYELDIQISGTFLWGDIQDLVLDVLLAHLKWERADTQIMGYNQFKRLAAQAEASTIIDDKIDQPQALILSDEEYEPGSGLESEE